MWPLGESDSGPADPLLDKLSAMSISIAITWQIPLSLMTKNNWKWDWSLWNGGTCNEDEVVEE